MPNYVSRDRQIELIAELENLKREGRREMADRLRRAKSFGDLSENSDYQEARDAQSQLERKIRKLEDVLRSSKVIENGSVSSSETVCVGSGVETERGGKSFTFTIVGSNEADPAHGLISNLSPIGNALIGKKVGDTIEIDTPKGKAAYTITAIK